MQTMNKRSGIFGLGGLIMALMLCFAMMGCSSSSNEDSPDQTSDESVSETRIFVDSAGREVEVPTELTMIAASGYASQQVLLTMAPDLLVGLAEEMSDDQLKYFTIDLESLPVFGAAFGGSGDMNKEALVASGTQIIIDTGEYKEGLEADLDELQEQLGIPVVFIETPLDGYDEAYEMLGDLLGMEERGEELSTYCADAYADTQAIMDSVPTDEWVNIAYLLGDAGLNAIAKDSYQSTVVDMCANNVVVVENPTGSGLGSEISLEQIAVWNPDYIVFGPESIYETVEDNAAWSGISAIESKNYYEVPSNPWTWLNNPPTVNQVLGMQWLPRLLYPDYTNDDMQEVVTEYFNICYGYNLSQEEYDELMVGALPL